MLKISKSIASVTEGSSSPTYSDVLGCWPLLLLLLALLCSRGAAAAAGAGEPVASPLLSPSAAGAASAAAAGAAASPAAGCSAGLGSSVAAAAGELVADMVEEEGRGIEEKGREVCRLDAQECERCTKHSAPQWPQRRSSRQPRLTK